MQCDVPCRYGMQITGSLCSAVVDVQSHENFMQASISMNCEVMPKVKVDKALKMSSNLIRAQPNAMSPRQRNPRSARWFDEEFDFASWKANATDASDAIVSQWDPQAAKVQGFCHHPPRS